MYITVNGLSWVAWMNSTSSSKALRLSSPVNESRRYSSPFNRTKDSIDRFRPTITTAHGSLSEHSREGITAKEIMPVLASTSLRYTPNADFCENSSERSEARSISARNLSASSGCTTRSAISVCT